MRNLGRLKLPKISIEEKQKLISTTVNFIKNETTPIKTIVFGSILKESFDAQSDIDVVAIYKTLQEADLARRKLYNIPRPGIIHPIEILCVDEQTFNKKSQIGGIYAVAKEEGKEY